MTDPRDWYKQPWDSTLPPITIRKHEYTVPIAATCTECGEPFAAGDEVTLSPPRHLRCDPAAAYMRDLVMRDFDALAKGLDL
jgi:hypothetical protein